MTPPSRWRNNLPARTSPLPDLDALALFVRIVQAGSLSRAARTLHVSKATLSRQLLSLEKALGTPLLHRSTRAQSLTDAGRSLFARAAPLVVEASDLVDDFRARHDQLGGTVRITAPLAYGQHVLLPVVGEFMRLHPQVRTELSLTDARVNLITEGLDLAVRLGANADSSLSRRALAPVPRVIVGQPAYLAARGRPRSAADLAGHDLLVLKAGYDRWDLLVDGALEELRVPWRLALDSMPALLQAAELGLGLALVPAFLAEAAVSDGRLEVLELDAVPPPKPVSILFPKGEGRQNPAVRAFIDLAVSRLGKPSSAARTVSAATHAAP